MTHTKRTVFCFKLQKEEIGLDFPPFYGKFGIWIFNNISKIVWNHWINKQTMLINEYKLNMLNKKQRIFLQSELKKYLFGENKNIENLLY